MNTKITDNRFNGPLVLFDANCRFCAGFARRFERLLVNRGFTLLPLQTPWVRARLALGEVQLLTEMRLLLPNGKTYGGADGFVQIARRVWWAWPLFALAQFPGAMHLMRAGYRSLAAIRQCLSGSCEVAPRPRHHAATTFFEMP